MTYRMPNAEELEMFYQMLETGACLELDWRCPGRRAPTPRSGVEMASKDTRLSTSHTPEAHEPMKVTDFDFSDDIAQPQMRVRHQNSTPKSAKKKTANFAGVMEVLKKKNAQGSN